MTHDHDAFDIRRKQFGEALGDGIALVAAGSEIMRNYDVAHPFRSASDFFFLTGFPEPEAVALFDPAHPTERYVLFVRPRDRQSEVWTGRRAGPEGAVADYGADAAYDLAELETRLREHLTGRSALFYVRGGAHDEVVDRSLAAAAVMRNRMGWAVPSAVHDPRPILHELRLRKSNAEIDRLRRACEISGLAHQEAMRFARPGLYEYQVQARLEYVFRMLGSRRDGYPSIVASGNNAWILHYVDNQSRLSDGDLLLIDAGAEYEHHSADITRSFPVNGTFTGPQRDVYELVLAAQEAAIGLASPGASIDDLHEVAVRALTEGMVELGLLPLGVDESIHYGHYLEFYPHGTSHWLGIDVHDAGAYRVDGTGRPFEPGMAFTVEPGLYVDAGRETVEFQMLPYDEKAERERLYRLGKAAYARERAEEKATAETIEHPVPAALLGIGIRIEDDLLITSDGHEVLTAATPKSIAEVEAACAEEPELPEA